MKMIRKQETVIKVRKSNIELLRIICMGLLIANHCIVHGGGLSVGFGSNTALAYFLIPIGKIAFDCFLAISTWFLVEQTFRSEKFLKVWLQVLFYSVIFTLVAVSMGAILTGRNWFSIFLPIAGNSHGFAASYLAFYLLIPFLAKIIKGITKNQMKWLLVVLIYAEVCTQIIGNISQYFQPMFSELLLFILFYFIAYYIKTWPFKLMKNNVVLGLIVATIWTFLFFVRYAQVSQPESQVLAFLVAISGDESSIFNIVAGFSLFLLFLNIKIPPIAIVNKIAKTTFAVLLIHDHNFFRYYVWNNIIKTPTWYLSEKFLFRLVITVVFVFVVCSLIDWLRVIVIEKTIFKSKKLQLLCKKIDHILVEKSDS